MGRVWRKAGGSDAGSGDDRLVEGLRRRSPDALAGLHEQYATGIYNLALRVVRHGPDAEDITQDVLIRAFERLPRDRDVLLRAWLYRLTLNRCYDHLRAAARRPTSPAAGLEAPSPNDPYEQAELRRLVEAALDDLTRRQRAALLLKDVHGLTLIEVAECLELTAGSVEVLLARARRAFRASFERHCREAGRSLPRSAGGLAMLPICPLPLSVAAAHPVLLAPPVAVGAPPLAAAAGGGIGAALGLPASFKTAALIVAAAATVSSAEVAATHGGDRPPRSPASVAQAAASASPMTAVGVTYGARPSPRASTTVPAVASPSPSPIGLPEPSAVTTELAGPAPVETPLGISGPSPAPTPEETPSAHAGSPLPSPSPSPTAETGASPAPSPSSTL